MNEDPQYDPEIPDSGNHRIDTPHPGEMRLRPARPSVTRLSRKVLVGLGIVVAVGICVALVMALQPHSQTASSELYNTNNRTTPDGLARLPHDYTGLPRNIPQLGPPLPGDLGRPILNAGAPAPGMPIPSGSSNPAQQHIVQEQEAARTSHLFTTTSTSELAPTTAPASPPSSGSTTAVSADSTSNPAAQDHKLSFLNAATEHRTVSAGRLEAPPSSSVLQAGAVIAAALITGLRSDLPGQVTAQVTEDTFDSPTGRILVIPQGARLVGQYDAQISFGQSRALVVWNRLIMPNGRSIVLERQPGADTQGYAGLEDEVDNHWGTVFKAAIVSTLLSVGSEAGTSNSENSLAQALRQGASQGFNQIGEQVVGRSLSVQPTITIRPGFPVRVLVTRDLVLEPYGT